MGTQGTKLAAWLAALAVAVSWSPAHAAEVRLGLGGVGRARDAWVGPGEVLWLGGPAGELSVDWRFRGHHSLGPRFRLLFYPPSWVELDAGLGYRYTFLVHRQVRPFVGGTASLAFGNECVGDVCAAPGFSGWLEGGVELRLDTVRLAAWLSPYVRYYYRVAHAPVGGSLWLGVVF